MSLPSSIVFFAAADTSTVKSFFYKLAGSFSSAGGHLTGVAVFIAGLFAVFNLTLLTAKIMSGDKVSPWELAKPFVILVIVAGFQVFVVGPVGFVSNSITNSINALNMGYEESNWVSITDAFKKYEDVVKKSQEELDENIGIEDDKDEYAEDLSFQAALDTVRSSDLHSPVTNQSLALILKDRLANFQPLGAKFSARAKKFLSNFTGVTMECTITIVSALCGVIFPIVVLAYQCMVYIYLAILAILGPFCFALSLVPGLRADPWLWVARYIEVSLWVPLSSMVYYVYHRAMSELDFGSWNTNMGYGRTEVDLAALEASFYKYIIIVIVCLLLLKHVKSLASIVVNAGGMGGVNIGQSAVGGARRFLGI